MKFRSLLKKIQPGLFNFFKKKKEQTIEQFIQQSASLGNYIKAIKDSNIGKPRLLPPKTDNKLTVVFEMQQVLSYTFTPDEEGYLLAPLRKYDHYTDFPEYQTFLSIYKRKNLDKFLHYLAKDFEPVLWTTGVKSYLDIMLEYIDPQKQLIYKFHQEHCNLLDIPSEEIDEYVKDLDLLGRDPKRIVYIDSRPLSFWLHPDNVIPLEPFKADNTMQEEDLKFLMAALYELAELEDVRTSLIEDYGLRKILEQAKML